MVYKSAVSKVNKFIYIGTIVFLILLSIPSFFEDTYEPFLVLFSIHFVIILFIIWTYKTTFYKIENTCLHWKSGPFYGEIDIQKINKIEYHKGIIIPTIWKPALSHIGIIITYNKYDNIYISPEKQEEFIAKLQRLNENIIFKNTPYAK